MNVATVVEASRELAAFVWCFLDGRQCSCCHVGDNLVTDAQKTRRMRDIAPQATRNVVASDHGPISRDDLR